MREDVELGEEARGEHVRLVVGVGAGGEMQGN